MLIRIVVFALVITASFQTLARPPAELGSVNWQRDLSFALDQSKKSGKPVFLLFQEVPGCATCSIYGQQILSHPLIVEAIEDLFIPVFVYNNRSGRDRKILNQYQEPSWNFPVVRYLKPDGTDLIPRKDRIWKIDSTISRMIKALETSENEVPNYLRLLAGEYPSHKLEKATFAMHCYWEGEARLGSLDGVVQTRAGWYSGNEVVEVIFSPDVIRYQDLLKNAQKMNCASRVFAHTNSQLKIAKDRIGNQAKKINESARDAKDSDQKFALKRTPLQYLPLTPAQATKVNADLRLRKNPERWLSPRQRKLLIAIKKVSKEKPKLLSEISRLEASEELAKYQQSLIEKLSANGILAL